MLFFISLFKSLSESIFFRNLATVMTGTALAQIAGVVLMPIISRLFSPSAFGLFSSYLSTVAIITSVATFQYQQALMLPKEDDKAFSFFLITLFLLSLSSFFIVPVFTLSRSLLKGILGFSFPFYFPFLLAIAVFFSGYNQLLLSWSARKKTFFWTSTSHFSRSFSTFSAQLLFGLLGFGSYGLIVGTLIGDMFQSILLSKTVLSIDWKIHKPAVKKTKFLAIALDFLDFPFYAMPQVFLATCAQGLPVLALGYFYGPSIAGFYALGYRIFQVPLNFILFGLNQVLFQKISSTYNKGIEIISLYKKSTYGLFLITFIPGTLGFLLSPYLFPFIFGDRWLVAGEYARWLVFMLTMKLCSTPSYIFARVCRKQKMLLYFELLHLISRITILFWGGIFLQPLNTIIIFSLTAGVLNLLLIFLVFFILLKDKNARC